MNITPTLCVITISDFIILILGDYQLEYLLRILVGGKCCQWVWRLQESIEWTLVSWGCTPNLLIMLRNGGINYGPKHFNPCLEGKHHSPNFLNLRIFLVMKLPQKELYTCIDRLIVAFHCLCLNLNSSYIMVSIFFSFDLCMCKYISCLLILSWCLPFRNFCHYG